MSENQDSNINSDKQTDRTNWEIIKTPSIIAVISIIIVLVLIKKGQWWSECIVGFGILTFMVCIYYIKIQIEAKLKLEHVQYAYDERPTEKVEYKAILIVLITILVIWFSYSFLVNTNFTNGYKIKYLILFVGLFLSFLITLLLRKKLQFLQKPTDKIIAELFMLYIINCNIIIGIIGWSTYFIVKKNGFYSIEKNEIILINDRLFTIHQGSETLQIDNYLYSSALKEAKLKDTLHYHKYHIVSNIYLLSDFKLISKSR